MTKSIFMLADGRYRYKYVDELGKSRYVYSKRLMPNDPAVHGKKEESLREKIAKIQKNKQDNLAMSRGNMTILDLVELYISQKIGVKPSTRLGYKTVVNFLKNNPFGKRKISSVKTSDARGWLIELQKNGRGYSSIHSIRGVLRPAFRLAYEDDFIRKNPFDFDNMVINVDHQLVRVYNEKKSYIIQKTKTTAGVRKVPMTPEVADCFRTIIKNRKKVKKEPLPTITPHVCRHTFCTKMAKAGMNPAKLKYIMGHSSMDITFDTYTHLQVDDVREEMLKMVEVENEKVMQEKAVDILQLEEESENLFNF